MPGKLRALLCLVSVATQIHPSSAEVLPSELPEHVQFREPHRAGYRIEGPSSNLKMREAEPWIKAFPDSGSTNWVQFGSRVVLQLIPGASLGAVLDGHALRLSRTISDTVFILQAPDVWTSLREAEDLAKDPRVNASYPVTRRRKQLLGPYAPRPNDPLFFQANQADTQWQANLENRDTNGVRLGVDLNVRAAWPISRGQGVVLALADDGVELDHPDLAARTPTGPHFNFLTSEPDGSPSGMFSDHGTAVAGLAAATANNRKGIAGVAPKAQLASWVIFSSSDNLATEEALADMFQYSSIIVHVQNHSWGKSQLDPEQLRLGVLENTTISNAVMFGRGGRGVVMVRAAGNGREEGNDANDDGYSADPRVISVAAIRLDGRVARYSCPGACVLVAAPGGDVNGQTDPCMDDSAALVTTDRQGAAGYNSGSALDQSGNYSSDIFNGTSASAPQIAGLVALILGANTNLTYRDVQQILVHSSSHYDLTDPTLTTNGAGFRVSHNLGFGVPDAGQAVTLAQRWSNRPPALTLTYSATNPVVVPDLGLRVIVEGPDVPESLRSIPVLSGAGPHPDGQLPALPVVAVGSATNAIEVDLRGKAALIQRGVNYFCEKITLAAQAGAALALVYNNEGGKTRLTMAETDLTPIPSVFLSQNDGQAFRTYLSTHADVTVHPVLQSTNYTFDVKDTLLCEYVGVRVDSDHTARGDLRIVLTSPSGTRSVLQHVNVDGSAGPRDWTYYSVQHFYESSFGVWTLIVADEDVKGTGSILSASLLITGVPITDTDHDGLDDNWEMRYFKTLAYGPADDPDHDGYSNAREQIMRTDPSRNDVPFRVDLSRWDQRLARLSWSSNTNLSYRIEVATETASPLRSAFNVPGQFPETEWFIPYTNLLHQFFRIEAIPLGN